jgi:ribonuclease-3
VTKTEGPDHNKIFTVEVSVVKKVVGVGSGRSKKEAEQNAAREALTRQPWSLDPGQEGSAPDSGVA